MVLNLINFIEAAILWILLIPELLFSIHHPPKDNQPKNKVMSIIEQIGRYSSMILMILPLGIMEFGFKAPEEMIIYFSTNGVLLLAYIVIFLLFSKKQSRCTFDSAHEICIPSFLCAIPAFFCQKHIRLNFNIRKG